jgi:hypothetical protein
MAKMKIALLPLIILEDGDIDVSSLSGNAFLEALQNVIAANISKEEKEPEGEVSRDTLEEASREEDDEASKIKNVHDLFFHLTAGTPAAPRSRDFLITMARCFKKLEVVALSDLVPLYLANDEFRQKVQQDTKAGEAVEQRMIKKLRAYHRNIGRTIKALKDISWPINFSWDKKESIGRWTMDSRIRDEILRLADENLS